MERSTLCLYFSVKVKVTIKNVMTQRLQISVGGGYRVLIQTFVKPNSVAYELCMFYQCSNVVPIFCTNMLYQMLYQIISNSMSLQREMRNIDVYYNVEDSGLLCF